MRYRRSGTWLLAGVLALATAPVVAQEASAGSDGEDVAATVMLPPADEAIDPATIPMPALAFTVEDRVAAKGQAAFVSKLCRDTVNAMMAASGASSFHVDQPMQRIWRDLNTVASHAFWDWDVSREQVGRQHFGLPPTNPLV